MSAQEFERAMTIESIKVSPDGELEFWFDDGDLFWGHAITVRGHVDRGLTDALFQG